MASSSPGDDQGDDGLCQLFQAVDTDNSGAIDETELSAICPDLSKDEVHYIFGELDVDGDGEITMAEFSRGFQGIRDSLLAMSQAKEQGGAHQEPQQQEGGAGAGAKKRGGKKNDHGGGGKRSRGSTKGSSGGSIRGSRGQGRRQWEEEEEEEEDEEDDKEEAAAFVGTLDDGFAALSCQEQVCELYQSLHAEGLPNLLTRFEEIILNVIRDIRQSQYENERLEKSFKREKETHANHLRQLEEEMEAQMQKVEKRVRAEMREQIGHEKEQMQEQLEHEIDDLKANLKRLQGLEPQLQEKAGEEYRKKIEDVQSENRYLQSQLTDSQTRLALIRSETATLRQNYEERGAELEAEKEMLLQYIKEQDNLTRQVHLLHDANQKLHDTNDDLRSALDNIKPRRTQASPTPATPSPKPSTGLPSMSRRDSSGDYVKEYLSAPSNNFARISGSSSLADELSMVTPIHNRTALPSQESIESDSIPGDLGTIVSIADSGHSTMRDIHESDEGEMEHDVMPRKRDRRRMPKSGGGGPDDDEFDIVDGPEHGAYDHDEDLEEEMETDYETDRRSCSPHSSVSQISGSHRDSARGESMRSSRDSAMSNKSVTFGKSGSFNRRQLPSIPQVQRPITGEPERMYKIVLCGDAAVGKSSFIMRLCKNKFVNNLSSTLGVDFQTKVLQVDGRIIALQLWDTAGQERFRSIAKSYFRRADGVLLLYDCTYERSFINIREWVDAVEDSAQKKIPMMIAGNKIDLRDEMTEKGKRCISYDDGHRLAREYDALFIETSAKDGDFVQETATEFARLLRTQEDLEVKTVGMQLQEMKTNPKKSQCCV